MENSWGRGKQWFVAAASIVLFVGRYPALGATWNCTSANTYISDAGDPPVCYLAIMTPATYFNANENERDVSVRLCAESSAKFMTGETKQTNVLSFSSQNEAVFVANYVKGLIHTRFPSRHEHRHLTENIFVGVNSTGWMDGSPMRWGPSTLLPFIGQKCVYFSVVEQPARSFTIARCMTVDEFYSNDPLYIVCKAVVMPDVEFDHSLSRERFGDSKMRRTIRSSGAQCELSTAQALATSLAVVLAGGLQ